MASKLFFNGRSYSTPTTVSRIDDSAQQPKSLTVGNVLAIIGTCAGGQPNTALAFGDPNEAPDVLVEGPLLYAVQKAFAPSAQTDAPSTVIAIRVGAATQSELTLLDSDGMASIALLSSQYGLPANQVKVKVEAGSIVGKKITTQLGQAYFTQDNIERRAFTMTYTGPEATATVSISATQVTLFAPIGTAAGVIELADARYVGQVVDRINVVPGFAATVVGGMDTTLALRGLDFVAGANVRAATLTATATLQAVIEWINGAAEGFVTASRPTGAGLPPANVPFTYLAGGTAPATTMQDWINAYDVLQGVDAQHVVPLTGDSAVHAASDAHCSYMSTVGRKERRSYVGPAAGTSLDAVLAMPIDLASDRTALCWPGFYDFDRTGERVLFAPFYTAVLVAAGFAGSDPGTAMTNKTLKMRGLELQIRNPTDTDRLIQAGVLCIEATSQGYKVVRSITTWLQNNNFNRVEISVGIATDFVARNVREAVDSLRGQEGTPVAIARAVSQAQSALLELAKPKPQGPGVIVGDAVNPAFRNIRGELVGDVLSLQFECSPVIPINFIPISIAIVPYSGTATA